MNLRLDLLTLQLFVAAVEEQSIARAAEKRNIAVSAVSRRISDLEDTLQVELLHRHSKGIEPTSAGVALLEHARTLMGNLAHLETELLGHRHGMRGHIRLSVNKSAILESLAEELGAFLQAHPAVTIHLEESISPDIIAAVAENRTDLGIFGGNILAPEIDVIPYRHDRLVAVVGRGHPLARRRKLLFSDLVEHEFISLEKGSSIDTLCVKAAAELGRQLKLRIRVSGFDALFRLVETEMGVGVVPREITRGRSGFAVVTLDEPWVVRPLVIGVRSQASLAPATRLLVQHLRASAAKRAEIPTLPEAITRGIADRDGVLPNRDC